jgi:UDP-N-acetylglucosamine 2-epimerase (non-hydrolysing)
MTIFLVVGTRPQIIKSAPIVYESIAAGIDLKIIHTGQHYDFMLSKVFLEEFSLPEPFVCLDVGSGTHIFQTAEIMLRLEKYFAQEKPELVLIPGDTNSALAGALAAVKFGIPTAHIEAGARCYDMQMAEEVNRRLIDHSSKILFAPTSNCRKNLLCERVLGDTYLSGDTMYDIFLKYQPKINQSEILDTLKLTEKEYILLTLHRAENVDNPNRLRDILEGIQKSKTTVIFPIHPRAKERLRESNLLRKDSCIRTIDPLGYIEMQKLLKNAKMVLTDSGGLQKEAYWSKTPCITMRDSIEWSETVDQKANIVTGADPKKIIHAINQIEERHCEPNHETKRNPFGNGKAANKIVEVLKKKLETSN